MDDAGPRVMKSPKSVEIDITGRCNLKCRYCSHFSSPGDTPDDLPTGEWLAFFDELGRNAVLQATLQGGEPFLREDLTELIDGIRKNRMRFSILSNGTRITEESAAHIAATGRCDTVQISIDGGAPETHDSCRGKGTFEKAVRGIEILRRHALPVSVRVTIHRHNYRDLDAVSKLLLEELKLPAFSTNSASHLGLCRENAEDVQMTTAEYAEAMESLVRLRHRYNGRISASAGPLATATHWPEMEAARLAGREGMDGCGFLTSCGGVYSKLAVRSDGVMTPCGQMGHIGLGRINKDDLGEVWRHHPELRRLRMRPRIPLSSFAFCEGCDYIPYCRGNCPALAYTLAGDENHPSPDACLRRFLSEGGHLPHVQ